MASFAGIDGTVARIDVTDETIDSGILNCPLFDVIALHSNMKKAESCHQGEMRKFQERVYRQFIHRMEEEMRNDEFYARTEEFIAKVVKDIEVDSCGNLIPDSSNTLKRQEEVFILQVIRDPSFSHNPFTISGVDLNLSSFPTLDLSSHDDYAMFLKKKAALQSVRVHYLLAAFNVHVSSGPPHSYVHGSLILHLLTLHPSNPLSNPFAVLSLLVSATFDYPHCNSYCFDETPLEGTRDPEHGCEEVNEYLRLLAARVTSEVDGRVAAGVWVKERFKGYNEGNKVRMEVRSDEPVQKMDVKKALLKREVWFRKGLDDGDEVVEMGLMSQIVRCMGVRSVLDVVLGGWSISRKGFIRSKQNLDIEEAVRFGGLSRIVSCMRSLLQTLGDARTPTSPYTAEEVLKELDRAIPVKLSPSSPDPFIVKDTMKEMKPLFPNLYLNSNYSTSFDVLLTIGEVVSVCTPDGEGTDRLGAFLVNAYCNMMFWMPNGCGMSEKMGYERGRNRAHPWNLADEKAGERRKRLRVVEESLGEDRVRRMFENARLMFFRDMVEVDTSVGYVGWLQVTNQPIRPDDEQVYVHGVNYSDKTVASSNKFPFIERRFWNHDDYRANSREGFGEEQATWVQGGVGMGAREWKNKALGPTYDYDILRLKREWGKEWNPHRHHNFGKAFKDTVMAMLLTGGKVGMPKEIIMHIIRFMGREWWGPDTEAGAEVMCWERQCCVQRMTMKIFDSMKAGNAHQESTLKPLKLCKCGVARYCSSRCKKGHAYECHGRVCGFSPCVSLGLSKEEEQLVAKVEGTEISKTVKQEAEDVEDEDDDEDWEDDDVEWEDVDDDELSDGGTTFQGVEGKEELTEADRADLVSRFFNNVYSKTRLPHFLDESTDESESDEDDEDYDEDEDDEN